MKLIDEKGKLFGLINIVDLLVVLVIVLAVGGVGYKLKARGTASISAKTEDVELLVNISDVRQATVDAIKVGDKFNHYNKNAYFGEIKEINVVPHKEAVSKSDGTIVMAPVPDKFDINLVFASKATVSDSVVVVGGEHTRVGVQFSLKNKNIAFAGTVMKIVEITK